MIVIIDSTFTNVARKMTSTMLIMELFQAIQ